MKPNTITQGKLATLNDIISPTSNSESQVVKITRKIVTTQPVTQTYISKKVVKTTTVGQPPIQNMRYNNTGSSNIQNTTKIKTTSYTRPGVQTTTTSYNRTNYNSNNRNINTNNQKEKVKVTCSCDNVKIKNPKKADLSGIITHYQHAQGIGMTDDRKENMNPQFYTSEIKALKPIIFKRKEPLIEILEFRSTDRGYNTARPDCFCYKEK